MRNRIPNDPITLVASCVGLIALIPLIGYLIYLALDTGEIWWMRDERRQIITKATIGGEFWIGIASHVLVLVLVILKTPSQIRKACAAFTRKKD